MLGAKQATSYSAEQKPQLIVVVDTEEEFDWSSMPDRNANSIQSIRQISRAQEIFDDYDIKPCYVIDFPIASQQDGIDHLKPILDAGRCEIGTHLHPWVNPPYEEDLTRSNMYPGNLGRELEMAKLKCITEKIEEGFGTKPEIYKAGRYGVGPNTTGIMEQLGYNIDLSVCSAFDYRADGGPDFSDFSAAPYWFGDDGKLLEIPLSSAFVGSAGRIAKHLYNIAGKLNRFRARGILARTGVVDRLMLSPEGYSTAEHKKLTRFLLKQGVRTFTWNFHSPSVVAGMTMYTSTERDVVNFLDSFRRYFDFFFDELDGTASSPSAIRNELLPAK